MAANDEENGPSTVDCVCHGRGVAAVLCGHLLRKGGEPAGFVENSSLPEDLQAWCDACERKFLDEGSMNAAFLAFNAMVVVCTRCYGEARRRHARVK